ncbi:unnamed protein product [Amoebophrya sp. A25]|nr:unnamed protein product [Amoebophrya sp. A25]|eukprot:GSA25T00024318001.1
MLFATSDERLPRIPSSLTDVAPGVYNLGCVTVLLLLAVWAADIAQRWLEYLELHLHLVGQGNTPGRNGGLSATARVLKLPGLSVYRNDLERLCRLHFNQVLRQRYSQPATPLPRWLLAVHVAHDHLKCEVEKSTSSSSTTTNSTTTSTTPTPVEVLVVNKTTTPRQPPREHTLRLRVVYQTRSRTGSVRAQLLLGVKAEECQRLATSLEHSACSSSSSSSRTRALLSRSAKAQTKNGESTLVSGDSSSSSSAAGSWSSAGRMPFVVPTTFQARYRSDVVTLGERVRTSVDGGDRKGITSASTGVAEFTVENVDLNLVRQRRVPILLAFQYEKSTCARSRSTTSSACAGTDETISTQHETKDGIGGNVDHVKQHEEGFLEGKHEVDFLEGKPIRDAPVELSLFKLPKLPSAAGTKAGSTQSLSLECIRQVALVQPLHLDQAADHDRQNEPTMVEEQTIFGFEDAEDTEDPSECMICYERQRNTMLLPCRHCSTCSVCLRSLREEKCPLCRTVFEKHVRFPYKRKGPRRRARSGRKGSDDDDDDDSGTGGSGSQQGQNQRQGSKRVAPEGNNDSNASTRGGGSSSSSGTRSTSSGENNLRRNSFYKMRVDRTSTRTLQLKKGSKYKDRIAVAICNPDEEDRRGRLEGRNNPSSTTSRTTGDETVTDEQEQSTSPLPDVELDDYPTGNQRRSFLSITSRSTTGGTRSQIIQDEEGDLEDFHGEDVGDTTSGSGAMTNARASRRARRSHVIVRAPHAQTNIASTHHESSSRQEGATTLLWPFRLENVRAMLDSSWWSRRMDMVAREPLLEVRGAIE